MINLSDSFYEEIRRPLLDNSNAVLSFEVKSESSTLDSDGNYQFATNTITLNAIIHSKNNQDSYFEGGDRKALIIRGRLTDPLEFPQSVKHLARGIAVINGRQGEFILHLLTPNPYTQNQLGQKFGGIFNEF